MLPSTVFVFFVAFSCATAVKIAQLYTPGPIKNGSLHPAVLDCDFSYDENEKESVVVKWFVQGQVEPVYQWIPQEGPPQGLGPLRGRLDLDYRVSEDNFTMHRALRIIRPTAELSGDYRCSVSSFVSEDSKTARFIVYSSGRVEIRYSKPTEDSVNVTCHVSGIYPSPTAEMIIYKGRRQNAENVQGTSKLESLKGDSYHVTLYKVFLDKDLKPETTFECVFSLPELDISEKDLLTYYPGSGNFAHPTGHMTSLIMTTEPTLIGIPTLIDGSSSMASFMYSSVAAILPVLLSMLLHTLA